MGADKRHKYFDLRTELVGSSVRGVAQKSFGAKMCGLPLSADVVLIMLATLPAGLLLAATIALLVVSAGGHFPIFGIVHRPLAWAAVTFASALIGIGLVANLAFEIAECREFGPLRLLPRLHFPTG